MQKIFLGCLIAVCSFSSCSSNEPDHDSTLGTGTDSIGVAPATDSIRKMAGDTSLGNPMSVPPTVAGTPQQMPASSTPALAGMNPAHGQPGHRCDIAVGAPLNSAPSTPAATTTSSTITPTTITPTANKTKTVTAPGMNPPHGEPGHRCDIAVGASLSSAPSKPATPTVTPAATTSPVVAPLPVDFVPSAKKDSSR